MGNQWDHHYGDCSSKRGTSLRTAQSHQHLFFPTGIALLLNPGWVQSSSSPRRRCFLPLCWCFNNLHSNVISKLASIVSSGRLCAMKLYSILRESTVVWEPMPAKVTCWEKNKWMEITVALQPWMPYQLGNNREKVGRKIKKEWGHCLSGWVLRWKLHACFVFGSQFWILPPELWSFCVELS